ncbi:MAG: Ig domain protein group 2 domain protein [Gemmatimonadetes bacterium]|nr:Ig domain protein group 2 domain protein [Gemmatimonadota bacterium]
MIAAAIAFSGADSTPPVPVAVIRLSSPGDSVRVGEVVTLSATVLDAAGARLAGRSVTWTTSSDAIATVSQLGEVRAVGPGRATIAAASEGRSGSAEFNVIEPVASVELTATQPWVRVNDTGPITVVLRSATGKVLTGRPIQWNSVTSSVATISSTGVAFGLTPGSTVVTATSEGHSGSVTVQVVERVSSVSVSIEPSTFFIGDSVLARPTLLGASGLELTGRAITWFVNTPAATVDANGMVHGSYIGAATITALSEGITGSVQVSVMEHVESVSIVIAPNPIAVGALGFVVAEVHGTSGRLLAGKQVTWSISDSSIVSVSAQGTLRGLRTGRATITATCEGKSGSVDVIVQ